MVLQAAVVQEMLKLQVLKPSLIPFQSCRCHQVNIHRFVCLLIRFLVCLIFFFHFVFQGNEEKCMLRDIHPPQQHIIQFQGDLLFLNMQELLQGRNHRGGIGHLQISASVTSSFSLISSVALVSGEK